MGTVQPIIPKGRVRCAAEVDAPAFTWTAQATSADPQLTGREVFARAAVKLLRSKRHHTFKSLASIFPSLCLLAAEPRLPDDTGVHEPSWRGVPVNPSDQDCRRLLRASATALARSGSRMVDGDVNIASSKENALDHPWFIYRLLVLRDRRTVARTVTNVRGSVAFTTRTLDDRVEFADTVNAADIGRVREKAELMPAPEYGQPPADGARKTRKRRRTMIYGATIPKILPTSDQVRKIVREAVDQPGLTPHAMLTLDPHGALRVWHYVVGSATTGTRWYELADGTRKRLAAPYHRRRYPPAEHGTTSNLASAARAADVLRGVCGQRVGGLSPRGADVTEAPETDAGPSAPSASHDPNAAVDPELLATFQITKATYLEDAPAEGGTTAAPGVASRERVVAVDFDPVVSLTRAFRTGCQPSSEEAIRRASVEVTLAADGGPVRRSAMTVFTLTASSELLRSGRTPLIPVLFLLGGEQAIHTAIGERLRTQLKRALLHIYVVPVDDSYAAGITPRSTAELHLPFFIHLCGDFAMIGHLLTLTGCGDINRCPYRWPCLPPQFLSTLLLDGIEGARARDASLMSALWEVVVWGLARWSTLRERSWLAAGGHVRWPCAGCGQHLLALSDSPSFLSCTVARCCRYAEPQAPLLPRVAYTPLSEFYRLLRRRVGGPRGYPQLGDIPFLIIAPVLHCTGKISKGLMFFLLAIMPMTMKTTARNQIYFLMGRNNVGGMYLREFGRLAALVVALPGVLSDDHVDVELDGGAVVMLQLSQLLTAAWRRAVSTKPAAERESAAVALQLTAALLAPLYSQLKPLDPVTKSAGVWNLYLHTALAHVRDTVGKAFPTLKRVCDDNIEGQIAGLNRYFNGRTNNVSRGQSLVNKMARMAMLFNEPNGRLTAELLMLTKQLVLCPCVVRLGPSVGADLKAVVRFACREPEVSVSVDAATTDQLDGAALDFFAAARSSSAASAQASSLADESIKEAKAMAMAAAAETEADVTATFESEQPVAAAKSAAAAELATAAASTAIAEEHIALERLVGSAPILFTLLAEPDKIRANCQPKLEESIELKLQRRLQAVQQRIAVCMCGKLSGRKTSQVADMAEKAAAAAAALAAAIEEEATVATKNDMDFELNDSESEVASDGCTGCGELDADCADVVAADGLGADDNAHDANGVSADGCTRRGGEGADGADVVAADGLGADNDVDGRGGWFPYHGEHGEDVAVNSGTSGVGDDVPMDCHRLYGIEDADLVAPDSEDEAGAGEGDGTDGAACCHPIVEPPSCRRPGGLGEFLVQAAVDDDAIVTMLPSSELIDVVLGPVEHAPNSPAAAVLRDKINEDIILLQLFKLRMRTPAFLSWAGRDGVLLRDVAQAADRLLHCLTCALRKLSGAVGTRV